MANRSCPLCLTRVPRAFLVCHSDELACPVCHARLELSGSTQVLSSTAGLLTGAVCGALAASLTEAAWSFEVVAACAGFAAGAAALVLFFSDLTVRAPGAGFPQTPV